MGMRFLLLCAEESLCIYTVPDYDQLARVETKHPILSSHIVSLNGKAAPSTTTTAIAPACVMMTSVPLTRRPLHAQGSTVWCASRGTTA